jgi:hypothetical protein
MICVTRYGSATVWLGLLLFVCDQKHGQVVPRLSILPFDKSRSNSETTVQLDKILCTTGPFRFSPADAFLPARAMCVRGSRKLSDTRLMRICRCPEVWIYVTKITRMVVAGHLVIMLA